MKTCPFCDSKAKCYSTRDTVLNRPPYRFWVMCMNNDCGCEIGAHNSRLEAIEFWDDRSGMN